MKTRSNTRRLIIGGVAGIAAIALAGTAVASQFGGDDNEAPITGDALTKATDAALAHTGGGRVTDTEVGDEDSYFEVEVTVDDGRQIDVHLDEQFEVVGADEDVEGETDD